MPAVVRRLLRPTRSNNTQSSAVSSFCICCDTAAWVRKTCSAATAKFSFSATATNVRSRPMSRLRKLMSNSVAAAACKLS
ncbi:hypothetical protein D3C72_1776490 [compost metagenome]